MKKNIILVCVLALLGAVNANATPIIDARAWGGGVGISVPAFGSSSYGTTYTLTLMDGTVLQAFCVENTPLTNALTQYNLLDLTTQIERQAAWIAEYYLQENRVGAQAAIWELLLGVDTGNSYGQDIIKASALTYQGDDTFGWVFAVAPINDPGYGGNNTPQDFLIKHPVPEPATMLLLGFTLIGIAITHRIFHFSR